MDTTAPASTTTPPNPTATASTQRVDLVIGGMTCASCAARIEKRLNKLDGVTATVNYATEQAKVAVPDGVTPDELIAQVEAAGYTARLPQSTAAASDDGDADETTDETAPLRTRPAAVGRRSPSRSSCWPWSRRCSSTAGSGCRSPWPPRS